MPSCSFFDFFYDPTPMQPPLPASPVFLSQAPFDFSFFLHSPVLFSCTNHIFSTPIVPRSPASRTPAPIPRASRTPVPAVPPYPCANPSRQPSFPAFPSRSHAPAVLCPLPFPETMPGLSRAPHTVPAIAGTIPPGRQAGRHAPQPGNSRAGTRTPPGVPARSPSGSLSPRFRRRAIARRYTVPPNRAAPHTVPPETVPPIGGTIPAAPCQAAPFWPAESQAAAGNRQGAESQGRPSASPKTGPPCRGAAGWRRRNAAGRSAGGMRDARWRPLRHPVGDAATPAPPPPSCRRRRRITLTRCTPARCTRMPERPVQRRQSAPPAPGWQSGNAAVLKTARCDNLGGSNPLPGARRSAI